MGLENAVAAAEGLRDLLGREIDRAEAERQQVRELDALGMLDWTQARERFHGESAALQRDLAEALTAARDAFGLVEVDLDSLAERAPDETSRLAARLAEIRSLAASLAEHDRLNRMVLERTWDIVRSYTSALRPGTVAYDRSGKVVPKAAAGTTRLSL